MLTKDTLNNIRHCVEVLEWATRAMHSTSLEDQVELAARVRGIRKRAANIEYVAKDNLRLTLWWPELQVNKDYEFPADLHKAVLRVEERHILQGKVLQSRMPHIAERYTKIVPVPRIRWDIR